MGGSRGCGFAPGSVLGDNPAVLESGFVPLPQVSRSTSGNALTLAAES
jgi:hypothetical protein